jgi:hypothetical protein
MVQRMANLALSGSPRVRADDGFQAIRAAMIFDERQLDLRPA